MCSKGKEKAIFENISQQTRLKFVQSESPYKAVLAVRIELEMFWGKWEALGYLDYSWWVPGVQEMKKNRITYKTWKLDWGQVMLSHRGQWVFNLMSLFFKGEMARSVLLEIVHINEIAKCLAYFKCSINRSCYSSLLIKISISQCWETEVGRRIER